MPDMNTDYEHGTPAGYNLHIKHETPPCDPCSVAMNRYQTASKIRRGVLRNLKLSLAAVRDLLNGVPAATVLERERGAEVVAAIRAWGGAE